MQAAGIIAEYNPLHSGHTGLMARVRRRLGPETAIVCAMSGNFVQRGDFALLRKHVRAEATVRGGADLVLELPLPWAVSSAERFASGGVQVLSAAGVVTHLAFGSECGDAGALMELAACLNSSDYHAELRRRLSGGRSFAVCRRQAAEALAGPERAALLDSPNNNLGVEYCRAILNQNASLRPLAFLREGPAHDSEEFRPGSAGAVRRLVREGRRADALSLMAPAMALLYQSEEAAGRAPVLAETCQRAVLARLRSMEEAEFAALDQGREGLYRRLYAASRSAASVEELLELAKTRRYAHARLRRMVLWAYLGLRPAEFPAAVPYLRVLAANSRGRALLAAMRRSALLPVLTKPAGAGLLSPDARRVFGWEARGTDLYTLAYPELRASVPGGEWRTGPVMLPESGRQHSADDAVL